MTLVSLLYFWLSTLLLKGLSQLQGRKPSLPTPIPRLSILIAARDEESQLPSLLEALERQSYPRDRFDIWIVDDRSQDRTWGVLQEWAKRDVERHHALQVTHKPPGISPKKHALSLALGQAKGEILVTTDADCLMGPLWLKELAAAFDSKTGLVLGLTTYRLPSTAGMWDKVMALEFASYAFVSAALVGLGFPVSGNANNIAYRREAHGSQNPEANRDHLVSGDDDFLLQGIHASGQWGIGYAISRESAVMTAPPDNARHFWEQRKRWAGKCMHYQPQQVAFLSLIFLYYLSILAGLVAGIFFCKLLPFALFFFAFKTTSDWRVTRKAAQQFGHEELMSGFVGAALLHIPLILSAVIAGSLGGFTWKGQKMKVRA